MRETAEAPDHLAVAMGVVEHRRNVGLLSRQGLERGHGPILHRQVFGVLEGQVGAVPVVRAGTREVVGIVSYVDVLRAAQDLFQEE